MKAIDTAKVILNMQEEVNDIFADDDGDDDARMSPHKS